MKVVKTDVLVFGAGPAGIAAAITAAKEGQKVCLIEVQNKIGGIMRDCPGMMFGGGYPLKKSVGGFFKDIVDEMCTMNPPIAERRVCSLENFGDEVVYDHEHLINFLYEKLESAGVKLLLNHMLLDVSIENNKIISTTVANPKETIQFEAKMYLDCTGNGVLADKAGVSSQIGDENGKMMGATLSFFLENVDASVAFKKGFDPYFSKYGEQGVKEGKIHPTIPQIYMLEGFRSGSVFVNTVTVTGIDGTDSNSITEGTNLARKRVFEVVDFCKKNIPGFENCYVNYIGSVVGIRETRKMEGMHTLTYEEVKNGTKFEDAIVACDNPLDEVFRDEDTTEYSHEQAIEQGSYYTIPFRSLVPKKIENLLFAGRNISVDTRAFSTVRGMPQCMIMGQSIGIGAAYAIKHNVPVQKMEFKAITQALHNAGVSGIIGTHI